MLSGRDGLGINVHRRSQCGMPHQFLHHFEFGSDAPEKRGIGVAECMPADALLDIEGFGNRPKVFTENTCAPVRPPSFVQSTRKYPVVDSSESAGPPPGQ